MKNTGLTPVRALGAISNLFSGDKDERQTALALLSDSPAMAMQVLADPEQNQGLTLSVQAKVLDIIIGEVTDPDEARALVEDNFHPERLAELMAERGGLPSAATHVLSKEQLVAAMLCDMGGDGGVQLSAAVVCVVWAEELKSRDDWSEILEMKFGSPDDDTGEVDPDFEENDLTVGDFLLLGLWYLTDRDVQTHQLSRRLDLSERVEIIQETLEPAELISYGFEDTDSAYDRLSTLLTTVSLNSAEISLRQLQMSEKLLSRRNAEKSLSEEAVKAAAGVDVDIDM